MKKNSSQSENRAQTGRKTAGGTTSTIAKNSTNRRRQIGSVNIIALLAVLSIGGASGAVTAQHSTRVHTDSLAEAGSSSDLGKVELIPPATHDAPVPAATSSHLADKTNRPTTLAPSAPASSASTDKPTPSNSASRSSSGVDSTATVNDSPGPSVDPVVPVCADALAQKPLYVAVDEAAGWTFVCVGHVAQEGIPANLEAAGMTYFNTRTVDLLDSMDAPDTLYVLAHESAHAWAGDNLDSISEAWLANKIGADGWTGGAYADQATERWANDNAFCGGYGTNPIYQTFPCAWIQTTKDIAARDMADPTAAAVLTSYCYNPSDPTAPLPPAPPTGGCPTATPSASPSA